MTIKDKSQVVFVGCDDTDIDLFENQYQVKNGMAYNSYVILDDKIAVMDTIDERCRKQWLKNVQKALNGRTPDYLIVHHMEPDHSASICQFMELYPICRIVCTAKAASLMSQFYGTSLEGRIDVVEENDRLNLGNHKLTFLMAPMVHWPEVMVSYESYEKILFSADAFGKFGALCNETDNWTDEARRYYFNICGKYGIQVQSLLKKATILDIETICPLHGPVLNSNISYYINLYNTWSSYKPECDGFFVAYASLHGHTAIAALELADALNATGIQIRTADLSRTDMSECVAEAFRYNNMVLAAASYDGGVMPMMKEFLGHLTDKGFRSRTIALIENGSWAPSAARTMRTLLENMKDITIMEPIVTIKSALNTNSRATLQTLIEELTKSK